MGIVHLYYSEGKNIIHYDDHLEIFYAFMYKKETFF